MKRFFILLFLFLILIFVALGFFSLNLDFIVNHPYFKNKLKNYLITKAIVLDYQRIHFNLYKGQVEVENLKFSLKKSDLNLDLFWPKSRFIFTLERFLKFKFFPSQFYLRDPQIKAVIRPTEEPIDFKKIISFLEKVSPFSGKMINGTLEWQEIEKKPLIFASLNFFIRTQGGQIFLEGDTSSSLAEVIKVKGRYDYRNSFLESSLRIKKLDLQKLPFLEKTLLTQAQYEGDLEIVYEKGIWNVGFLGSAPCLAFSDSEKPLVCGFFQGSFIGTPEEFKLKVAPIQMKYPKIEGEILLAKEKGKYSFNGAIKEFSLTDLEKVLSIKLSSEVRAKVFAILRGGIFKKVSISTEGKNFKELFTLENFKIKGEVEKGELILTSPKLYLSEIQGEVAFEHKEIKFRGKALLENSIKGEVESLSLDLLSSKGKIELKGGFKGEGNKLLDLGKQFIGENQYLQKIQLKGELKGKIELKGPLDNFLVNLDLFPDNLEVKNPYLSSLILKSGEISYGSHQIVFRELFLVSKDSFLKGLEGELNLIQGYLEVKKGEGEIDRNLIEELSFKIEPLKEVLEKYKLDLEKLTLQNFTFKTPWRNLEEGNFLTLVPNLSLEGKVYNLKGEYNYAERDFFFLAPLISFTLEGPHIFIKEGVFNLFNSTFEIKGDYDLENSTLNLLGSAEIKEEFLENFEEIFKLQERGFSFKKAPLKVKQFSFLSDPLKIEFKGLIEFFNHLNLEIFLKGREKVFLEGRAFSSQNNFSFSLKKEGPFYFLLYNGSMNLEELSQLVDNSKVGKGKIQGEVEIYFSPFLEEELLKLAKFSTLKEFLEKLLKEPPWIGKGTLTIRDLQILADSPIVLTGSFFLEKDWLRGEDLSLRRNSSEIKGSLEVALKVNFFEIKGNFKAKELKLKDLFKKEKKEESPNIEEVLLKLPVKGEITLGLDEIVLSTSHKISQGEINFKKERGLLRIEMPQMNFCGLKFSGEYERNLQFKYIFINLDKTQGEFLDLFSCLYPEEMPEIIFEGPFVAEGFFYSDGEKELLENSYGKLEVISKKGYIYRAPLLVRVLAFLSPIDLFRGKVPNLENNLLPYEEMNLKGEFKDSSFDVDTYFLSAPGFRLFANGPINWRNKKLSLTFLVSLFKTIDEILEKIPGINKWVLGKERMLIYLPLEVVGTYDDPTIVPLHPSSLGKGFFRFIFKFLGIQEEFYKKPETFEDFKKKELLQEKSGNSLRR